MAPRRTRRRMRPTRAVQQYNLFVTAHLSEGFTAVGPKGGFTSESARHFIGLSCLACGDLTKTDVGLYLLESDTRGCTEYHGARRVCEACYPKCRNNAHMVRECGCRTLGSVELTVPAPAARPEEEDRVPLVTAQCIGYAPVRYSAGPGWVATTATGLSYPIAYSDSNDMYYCFNKEAAEYIPAGVLKYNFVKAG